VGELFAQENAAWAYAAFESAVHDLDARSLCEVVVVGATHACVAQRAPWAPERAVVTVGTWEKSVGTVVADARAALAQAENAEKER
jgi:hypothetical protein